MSSLCLPLLALALAAGPTVSMEHHGTLRQALNELAKQGHLNLIATGNLDVPAEVTLHDAAPEEALEVVAQAYGLKATHVGKMWVLKPSEEAPAAAPAEKAAAAPEKGAPPATPPAPPGAKGLVPPVVVVPAVPPVPLVPELHVGPKAANDDQDANDDAKDDDPAQHLRDAAERARERAEEARDQVEEAKEQAEEIRQAEKEREDALKEEAQAHKEALEARLALKGKGGKSAVSTGPVVVPAGSKVNEAVSYGGPVTVEAGARVDGDAVAFGGDVVLKAGARVDGDAVSFGGKVVKEAGARVDGEEVSFGAGGIGSMVATGAARSMKDYRSTEEGKDSRSALARFLVEFAVLFGLGFLCLMFAPARMRTIEAEIRRQPVKNGLAGLVAMLASIPLTFVLVITVIGIPVAVLFWLAAGLGVVMGLIAISNIVGEKVPFFRRRRTQALVLALGLCAVLLASRVPVLGPITMSLATMVAIGAIIRTRMGQRGQGLPVPDLSNQGVPVA